MHLRPAWSEGPGSGFSLAPKPRRSGAIRLNRSARRAITGSQVSQNSGQPCRSTRGALARARHVQPHAVGHHRLVPDIHQTRVPHSAGATRRTRRAVPRRRRHGADIFAGGRLTGQAQLFQCARSAIRPGTRRARRQMATTFRWFRAPARPGFRPHGVRLHGFRLHLQDLRLPGASGRHHRLQRALRDLRQSPEAPRARGLERPARGDRAAISGASARAARPPRPVPPASARPHAPISTRPCARIARSPARPSSATSSPSSPIPATRRSSPGAPRCRACRAGASSADGFARHRAGRRSTFARRNRSSAALGLGRADEGPLGRVARRRQQRPGEGPRLAPVEAQDRGDGRPPRSGRPSSRRTPSPSAVADRLQPRSLPCRTRSSDESSPKRPPAKRMPVLRKKARENRGLEPYPA